ncbi:MAG: ribonuclease HIII [Bacilli bacterium]
MSTITVSVSDKTKESMSAMYDDMKRLKTPPYALFQADDGDTVVTLYQSGKAVFQGKDADLSSQLWIEMEKHNNPDKSVKVTNSEEKKKDKVESKDPKVYNFTTIGSDEVGTGDYFGPMVVTAAYVKKEDISFLESLGVKDSKKMTDEAILEVVPKFYNKIIYSTVVLSNKEYNERYASGNNMNKLKAILHNKVLSDLKMKGLVYDYIVVDQFAEKYVYFSYLKDNPSAVKNITFMTKAEDKCLSVACASLISRFIFLKEFGRLSESIGILLPKGAGTVVDNVACEVVKKYGFEKLNEVAKINFKNTSKVKELLNM